MFCFVTFFNKDPGAYARTWLMFSMTILMLTSAIVLIPIRYLHLVLNPFKMYLSVFAGTCFIGSYIYLFTNNRCENIVFYYSERRKNSIGLDATVGVTVLVLSVFSFLLSVFLIQKYIDHL